MHDVDDALLPLSPPDPAGIRSGAALAVSVPIAVTATTPARDNGGVSELLPDRTSDEWDDGDDERDEQQRERQLEEERPPHHEPR